MRALLSALLLCAISTFSATWGHPLVENTDKIGYDVPERELGTLSSAIMGCRSGLLLKPDEFSLHQNGTIYILSTKRILEPSEYINIDSNLCIREHRMDEVRERTILDCDTWTYEPEEFKVLLNGSVLLYGKILALGSFEIEGGILRICVDDYEGLESIAIPDDTTYVVVNAHKIGDDVPVKDRGNLSAMVMECSSNLLLKADEFSLHQNGTVYIFGTKRILEPSEYIDIGGNLCIREHRMGEVRERTILDCDTWTYEPEEFQVLNNGSVLLYGEILELGSFEIERDILRTCVDEYEGLGNITIPTDTTREALIYVGQIGAMISIISLALHLMVFALVPARRNLPGYNLASLSVAFLLGYFFLLFGQIPTILGMSCVVSASLEHFFFLSAFFWMNIISFDVCRSLRLATNNLIAPSGGTRKLRFLCYSIYAWGIPFWLAVTAVTVDYSSKVSSYYKPFFGRFDICWFTNENAKFMFFGTPVIVLLVSNTIFFILSAVMIVTNTMSDTGDQQRTAKRNVALYSRLAIVMGVVWLTAIAGMVFQKKELWFIFDALNSLQGFFVFMLFSFSRVLYLCKTKGRETSGDSAKSSTLKNSTTRSRSDSQCPGK